VQGKELIARGMSIISDLGMRLFAAGLVANWIWVVTDDPVVAEEHLRESYEALREAGEKGVLGTVAASLAEALYRQGRYEEAEQMARVGEETASVDDVYLQVLLRTVRAKLLARRELLGEAEKLAREAVTLAFEGEYVDARGEALLALGEVLRQADRPDEAAAAWLEAVELWTVKGNVVFASRARALFEELQLSPSQ
jgi:tetratricopeptide (TPR) repeat protein